MTDSKPTVIFIAGASRSGTTLLERLLSRITGIIPGGELMFFWDRGARDQALCSCGRRFSDCPFWQAVTQTAFPEGMPDPAEPLEARRKISRIRHIPRLAVPSTRTREQDEALALYADFLRRIYSAMLTVSGGEVVVDSSNLPVHGFLLRALEPSIDVRVVHLVRDSRAVAFSWSRAPSGGFDSPEGSSMRRLTAPRSAVEWIIANTLSSLLTVGMSNAIRIRYESLAANPGKTVDRVLSSLGLPWSLPGNQEGLETRLGEMHTFSGNPMRFQHGIVPIRVDDEWRTRFPPVPRTLVGAMTWPWLMVYNRDLGDAR